MRVLYWMSVVVSACLVGCSGSDESQSMSGSRQTSVDTRYVATYEPEGAVPVGEARTSVVDQEDLTMIGTIGGSSKPFVGGLAAFTVVDPSIPCYPPEEGCPRPWDYCCKQDQVKDNIATVKVVDENGKPVISDARDLLGVKELSTVVVQGRALRDEQGNLTVEATKVFVRPSE